MLWKYNGKALPEGTVRTWGGQQYKKEGGNWVSVSRASPKGESKKISQEDAIHKYGLFLETAKEDLGITDEDLEYDDGSLSKQITDLATKKYDKWLDTNNISVRNR